MFITLNLNVDFVLVQKQQQQHERTSFRQITILALHNSALFTVIVVATTVKIDAEVVINPYPLPRKNHASSACADLTLDLKRRKSTNNKKRF